MGTLDGRLLKSYYYKDLHALHFDDDIQVKDDDEDPEKDPKEDPSKEHEPEDDDKDLEEDPNKEHEPEDKDTKEPSEGLRAAMIHMIGDIPEEDMPPRKRFVLTAPPPWCDVPKSSAAAARAPRKQRMLVILELYRLLSRDQAQVRRQKSVNFYTQLLDAQTDRRNIRLEIDVNRALLAPIETLKTHMSHMEWQLQSVEDLAVTQLMRIHALEARAWTDTVEDTDELALLCTKFLADETEKVDKYISGLPDNVYRNVMSARPKTLNETIDLANDMMDKKLRTYTERQNDNKRKGDDSLRNNQQHQPHKKQNVARVYTVGLGEKKVYTGDLPLCTKCNYHHTGKCPPKYGRYKRYGHTTTDCRVNTNNKNKNNNNKNQKPRACYECGNTRHIKKNCPKQKNHRNGSEKGIAQGRAYALGGRDASPDANVSTSTFLLNNHYAKILFDIYADGSFVATTFSALVDITLTTLENHYEVELSNGKIIGVNTIIRGCTLNFLNHPFNLMSVPLSSFDVTSDFVR
nr:hypothetical protein [Tanacetum cinerariifolium]